MVFAYSSHAADARNRSVHVEILSMDIGMQQDSLSKAKKTEKKDVEKDKKEKLPQDEDALKKVPKAKNKAIPRAIVLPSINIKSPSIVPIKIRVKVNTQVKIKL